MVLDVDVNDDHSTEWMILAVVEMVHVDEEPALSSRV
jgi:hypothetical protein